jgi:integrase
MTEFTEKDIQKILTQHKFWGTNKEWTQKYESIQKLAWRMIKREKHSFQTFRRYIGGIKHLVEYLKVQDPDQALEKLKTGDPTKTLDGFIGNLTLQDVKPVNIKSIYYAVQKFCVANEIVVNWDFIARPKAVTKIKDRVPSNEELKTILNFANIRDKALFMAMLSSGLRVGTAMSLKVKDYKPLEDLAVITVEGGEGRKLSEGFWYWTFTTPETRKIVDSYLQWRQRNGETITPESTLFTAIEKETEIQYTTNVSRQWRRLVEKAGLCKMIEGTGWLDIHLHVLRKFFHTKCKGAGIKPEYYDFWMGHTQEKDLADSYWREEIPKHLIEYKKAIPDLGVYDAPRAMNELEFRKRALIDQLILLRPEIDRTALENMLAMVKSDEELDDFRGKGIQNITAYIKEKPEGKRCKTDNCQKIVSEENLEQYLGNGWKVVTALQNGKVVISNE